MLKNDMLAQGEQHFLILLISSQKQSLKGLRLPPYMNQRSHSASVLDFSHVTSYNGKLFFHIVIKKNKAIE